MNCYNCRSSVSAGDDFCGNCGHPLENLSKSSPESHIDKALDIVLRDIARHLESDSQAENLNLRIRMVRRWRWVRLSLIFSVLTLTILIVNSYLNIFFSSSSMPWEIPFTATLCAIALFIGAISRYKTSAKSSALYERIQVIEKIDHNAAFVRDVIQAVQLKSDGFDDHLSPAVASAVENDPILKSTWEHMHQELQRLYVVLGPPPMKSLLEARNG